jgi:uncharacterized protein YjbI with pentapeptide repeats
MKAETESSWADEPEEPRRSDLAWFGWRLVWIGGIATLALVLGVVGVILYGYLAEPVPGWVGVSDKKFWDYLELLIGPAVLAVGAAWLNWALRQREARLEDKRLEEANHAQQQRERERAVTEEARREREREAQAAQSERELEVENQRAQDAALQAYLDQMSQLLLDKAPPLRQSEEDSEVRTLARARTLTVLSRLDGDRKAQVVQFLYESGLIAGAQPIVDLSGADLSRTNLRGGRLFQANLSYANLREADLSRGANLREANLSYANLSGADLSMMSDLSYASLIGADLSGANLSHANLAWATITDPPPEEITDEAITANLSEANLRETILNQADLSGAILHGATGWTEEQLAQARSLGRAIMPNGQEYEDWLKSKGRGEDGEGSGPA